MGTLDVAEGIKKHVGKMVYRIRSGKSCTYEIIEISGGWVALKCTHKGGRSTGKMVDYFWDDYQLLMDDDK